MFLTSANLEYHITQTPIGGSNIFVSFQIKNLKCSIPSLCYHFINFKQLRIVYLTAKICRNWNIFLYKYYTFPHVCQTLHSTIFIHRIHFPKVYSLQSCSCFPITKADIDINWYRMEFLLPSYQTGKKLYSRIRLHFSIQNRVIEIVQIKQVKLSSQTFYQLFIVRVCSFSKVILVLNTLHFDSANEWMSATRTQLINRMYFILYM